MAYNLQMLFQEVDTRFSANPALTLVELAQELRIHRHTLERAVCGASGITFREYRQKRRLDRALHLLIEAPSVARKEIAHGLGFKSAAAFSRFVKKMTGKTPSRIRAERAFVKTDTFASLLAILHHFRD